MVALFQKNEGCRIDSAHRTAKVSLAELRLSLSKIDMMDTKDCVRENTMGACRLSAFKAGDEGVITEISGTGSSPMAARLQEMGLVPGAWIRCVQAGSPLLLQIGESRICVRANEAALVSAEVISVLSENTSYVAQSA